MSTPERRQIPRFATEAEEAAWWYEHREEHDAQLLQAIKDGTVRRRSHAERIAEVRARKAAAEEVTVRLSAGDAARARALAESAGVEYTEWLRQLLHDALEHHSPV